MQKFTIIGKPLLQEKYVEGKKKEGRRIMQSLVATTRTHNVRAHALRSHQNKNHHSITSNPSEMIQSIRNANRFSLGKIENLCGEKVVDGFFDNLSILKSIDKYTLDSSASFKLFNDDYQQYLFFWKTNTSNL